MIFGACTIKRQVPRALASSAAALEIRGRRFCEVSERDNLQDIEMIAVYWDFPFIEDDETALPAHRKEWEERVDRALDEAGIPHRPVRNVLNPRPEPAIDISHHLNYAHELLRRADTVESEPTLRTLLQALRLLESAVRDLTAVNGLTVPSPYEPPHWSEKL